VQNNEVIPKTKEFEQNDVSAFRHSTFFFRTYLHMNKVLKFGFVAAEVLWAIRCSDDLLDVLFVLFCECHLCIPATESIVT